MLLAGSRHYGFDCRTGGAAASGSVVQQRFVPCATADELHGPYGIVSGFVSGPGRPGRGAAAAASATGEMEGHKQEDWEVLTSGGVVALREGVWGQCRECAKVGVVVVGRLESQGEGRDRREGG